MLRDSQEVSISLYNKVERPRGLIIAWSISVCVCPVCLTCPYASRPYTAPQGEQ